MLNMLVIERNHCIKERMAAAPVQELNVDDLNERIIPFGAIRIMHVIILTDTEEGTFTYIKSRDPIIRTGTAFDIGLLPRHIALAMENY